METIGERYGPLLRGYLGAALGDAGSTEDVMQVTMLDVWRRGPSYDPERSSLTTWLLMIARSRAIDHLRRRVPEPFDPASVAEVIDEQGHDDLDALLERWRVAGLMSSLPKQEAMLLRLRFYDGLTQRQISERTGIALGTVKMQMVRALERLRQTLESEQP